MPQVLLPDRLTGGAVLPGATRSGARSYEFDACLPGQTTQVRPCGGHFPVLCGPGSGACEPGRDAAEAALNLHVEERHIRGQTALDLPGTTAFSRWACRATHSLSPRQHTMLLPLSVTGQSVDDTPDCPASGTCKS
mgnify:CR=1 FL=1